MKRRTTGVGVLKKRRVYGRDGDTHTEYKVQCNLCNAQTDAHRSKLIALKEWAGKQEPEDGLPRRSKARESRAENIALNREAEMTKGDGRK